MADSLYLSLWFPSFDSEEMLPRLATVLRLFPFSAAQPGVSYVCVQPISWAEPSVLERRFTPPASPEAAIEAVAEFAHEDHAVSFEAYWDLWSPDAAGEWGLRPSKVNFIANGKQFDEASFTDVGHLQIDFGLDYPFLHEHVDLSDETELRVKANVAKLVDFTHRVERDCGVTGRVLWSESEENLAQKLIARLQRSH